MSENRNKIKVLVADDEPAARASVICLLTQVRDVEIAGQCINGNEVMEFIPQHKPDLVFLDVQMPGLNGMEVMQNISKAHVPYFILSTAHEDYAIKAFDMNVLDYLLKPYDDERFYRSLDRARELIINLNAKKNLLQTEQLLGNFKELFQNTPPHENSFARKINVKNKGKISFIPVEEIAYLESEGSFVKAHLEKGIRILNYNFKELLSILNPELFVRIHKSYIVNLGHIETIEPYFRGDYFIYLKTGKKLRLSRNYKEALEKILK